MCAGPLRFCTHHACTHARSLAPHHPPPHSVNPFTPPLQLPTIHPVASHPPACLLLCLAWPRFPFCTPTPICLSALACTVYCVCLCVCDVYARTTPSVASLIDVWRHRRVARVISPATKID
ncbi:hypothetical protein BC567DRAFT_225518 [Phyllosticta citribraziliensis]